MIRSLTSFLTVLGTIWALSGCRPDFAQEMKAVQSMTSVLDGLDMRINDLDTVAAHEAIERLHFQCARILPLLDSLAQDSTNLTPVTSCDLPDRLTEAMTRRNILAQELKHTRQQLLDLHSDLREGRANKDSVSAFIEVEFLYVEHLGELLDDLSDQVSSYIHQETAARPIMDSLMTVTTAKFVE
ncbi:MAG: hypothetical protein K9J06_13530 [Flavobacteriales bacterium]|nr:hypothetical protein [Flavobacteriales bacterium]